MKKESNASSSDLDTAREVSQRLRGKKPAGAAPEPGGYIRFSSARVTGQSAGAAAPDVGDTTMPIPSEVLQSESHFGPEGWDKILDWCLETGRADAAFVMDDRGLVIANRGRLSNDEAEAMGARLILAVDQASRIEPAGEDAAALTTVSLELRSSSLTGLRVPVDGQGNLNVGILSPEPIARGIRRAIAKALQERLASS